MFLVHVNVCDFADTMLIVVQIKLIWFDFWFVLYQLEINVPDVDSSGIHGLISVDWDTIFFLSLYIHEIMFIF